MNTIENINWEEAKKILDRSNKLFNAVVDEVMNHNVITVDFNDSCAKAARIILENGFLSLLVLKEGKPFNSISVFELLRIGYDETFDPKKDYLTTKVGEIIKNKRFYYLPYRYITS